MTGWYLADVRCPFGHKVGEVYHDGHGDPVLLGHRPPAALVEEWPPGVDQWIRCEIAVPQHRLRDDGIGQVEIMAGRGGLL